MHLNIFLIISLFYLILFYCILQMQRPTNGVPNIGGNEIFEILVYYNNYFLERLLFKEL